MDSFLIDYLKSGKAWILVGSGPSNAMGYPSWSSLASYATEAVKTEIPTFDSRGLIACARNSDYPGVFEEAMQALGAPRLRQILLDRLRPTGSAEIYKLITRWPAAVYLTTNFDDEIQTHLAEIGEAYIPYSNSEDHFGFLFPELHGAIVKIHGDLRSDTGLILTAQQYRDIADAQSWEYWRTKMTSVFQMNRMIVIGHSLTDPNIRHVLQAARRGASVHQPICWIAPDVPTGQVREFLEKYRIRVIPYDNRDGRHTNLVRLVQHISEFVPPRESIAIQQQILNVSRSPLGTNAAAPSIYVFNKLSEQSDFEEKRVEIIVAAMQSALPNLSARRTFTLKQAFTDSGWPENVSVPVAFFEQVRARATESGLLTRVDDDSYIVAPEAESLSADNKARFEHLRERFKSSLQLRVRRLFPALNTEEASTIASDIEASLTGYFREGGLSLATTLFSSTLALSHSSVPSSIVGFINEASARYDSLLMRQAFSTISVDAFVHSEAAERDFLGRVSQGFFAYHSLGVFGDVAIERLKNAKETVWLVDSNAQIPVLALAAPTNQVFVDCFTRLRDAGVRLFTTVRLFDETCRHLWFADNLMTKQGPESPDAMAAALGQAPYRRSNQFLEGFFRWRAAGNLPDWGSYLSNVLGGKRNPSLLNIQTRLEALGVEVIAFNDWPGFSQNSYNEAEEWAQEIVRIHDDRPLSIPMAEETQSTVADESSGLPNPYRKALPEAEAYVIVRYERDGSYYMISDSGQQSTSWFISNTAILNLLDRKSAPVTWHPEAFLRFAATLSKAADDHTSDRAFQTVLWACAQSGLTLLDENTVASVMGGPIDQATLDIYKERKLYADTTGEKYGEDPDAVLRRMSPVNRPLAAIQLANERAQMLEARTRQLETIAAAASKRANVAEKKLDEVEKFRVKMETKKVQSRQNARRQKGKQMSKKKRRR